MNRKIQELIENMTLEEKASMCSGFDNWHTQPIERLGIPALLLSDGPHGLRKTRDEWNPEAIHDSIKAVCFPAACATASSFDRELLYAIGEALGGECQAENVAVLLGPAVNIKRSPLCGRNFEYFSEDPYLTSELAASYVKGVQSKNVGTSLKHFAGNNQETCRMSCSDEVDERTLREIYLAAFETAVKEGKPATLMCSYNRINGVYSAENEWLLNKVLREEWGYEGFVMSDWGAVNDRVDGIKAGLELEMPGCKGMTDAEIVEAVLNGKLEQEVLDRAVGRILEFVFFYTENRLDCTFDRQKDHEEARRAEEESLVLLKNEGILPLNRKRKTAFIGLFAEEPRYQGGGSSHINSDRVVSALEAVKGVADDVTYARGYRTDGDETDKKLLDEATEAARQAETAVIFAGLPDNFESEGYDRTHMRMPECQNELIEAVARVQPNTIVVLHNGSPVEMPWIDQVKGVLEMYLGGQAVGEAAVNALFGKVNPSGRLAESFPLRLEDNPSYLNFPGEEGNVEYKEGIYVGYRYYDSKKMDVLFPFGYGLSYTDFEYSDLRLSSKKIDEKGTLHITLKVKNTGKVKGKEVVQLYVSDKTKTIARPEKELKNFVKIELEPGESKTVTMTLKKRAFSSYHPALPGWYMADGEYEILVGKSSRNIVLRDTVEVSGGARLPLNIHVNMPLGTLLKDDRTKVLAQEIIDKIIQATAGTGGAAKEAVTDEMIVRQAYDMPLRALRSFLNLDKTGLDALLEKFRNAAR